VYIEGVAASKAIAGKLNHLFKCVDGLCMGDEVETRRVLYISHSSHVVLCELGREMNIKAANMRMTHTTRGKKLNPREMCYICIANGCRAGS
jgi:hypothetical protein